MNKSLVHKPEDMSFNAIINSNIVEQVTPVKKAKIITSSPRSKKTHHIMSLQDEMNEHDEFEENFDGEEVFDNSHQEVEQMEVSDKTLQDELNETEDTMDTLEEEEEKDDYENEQFLADRKVSTTSISSIPNREINVSFTISILWLNALRQKKPRCFICCCSNVY